MIGYKVFNPDWTCRGFQYEVGKTYEIDKKPICCVEGFHFCRDPKGCFNHYHFEPSNKVAIVEAFGDIVSEYSSGFLKYCTNKIKIIQELSWEEVLEIVNVGYKNTGFGNFGRYNSGNFNSGVANSKEFCLGDFNSRGFCFGGFNTESSKIFMFNKPTNMTLNEWWDSEASSLLEELFEEGYMDISCTIAYSPWELDNGRQRWYDNLSDKKKQIVLDMPNFDPDIFKEITGIDVMKESE